MNQTATAINEAIYDHFWQSCPDFSRYNPGILHRRRGILKRLRSLQFRSLLDVGCGNGELMMWLRPQLPSNVAYSGVDLSSKTIEQNIAQHPFADFQVLNIQQTHLDSTYDVVVCSEVIEHLDDHSTAMAHIAALVAPGGHLVLTCPTGKVHATERFFGHVSHPTVQEIRNLAERHGLEVVSLDNWGFPLYTGLKYATNVSSERVLRGFATGKYSPGAKFISKALYWVNLLNPRTTPVGCQLFLVARKLV